MKFEEEHGECPAPGCKVIKHRERFACPDHWFQLPKEMRDQIWSTFKKRNWAAWQGLFEEAQQHWKERQQRDKKQKQKR